MTKGQGRTINVLVFGGLVLVVLAEPFFSEHGLSYSRLGLLSGTAVIGYLLAEKKTAWRAWGVVSFLLGWFASPATGFGAVVLGAWIAAARGRTGAPSDVVETSQPLDASEGNDEVEEESEGPATSFTDEDAVERSLLALKTATEFGQDVVAMAAKFHSVYGEGTIPILVRSGDSEKAIYVEGGLWTQPRQEVALKWLGLLRTSDREDLDVEFRSEDTVPPVLLFYAQRSARVTFELVGLLNYCWVETEDFAEKNTATLKRLLHEYLDVEFGEGLRDLEKLDRFVVHTLRGDTQDPWTLNSTFVLVGSFFGNVLQKLIGGRWLVTGRGTLEEVVLEVTSEVGRAKVNVFKRVLRLYDNGIQDGTALLAKEVLTQLGVNPGGERGGM